MLGHGGIVALRRPHRHARARAAPARASAPHESCGMCFPCRIGLQRGLELVEADGPVDRALLEELLETLEVASLCAHGGGMPAPIRSLLRHFPRGAAREGHRRRRRGRGRARARPCSRRSALAGRRVPTLCFDDRLAPFGACRVCLVGIDGKPAAACTTPCRDGMVIATDDPQARRIAAQRGRARPLGAARAAGARTPSSPRSPRGSASASRAGAAPSTSRGDEDGHPYLVAPPRALHLVRPLRPGLRRGAGRVRAHRDRPRLRRERRRRPRRGLPGIDLRLLWSVR